MDEGGISAQASMEVKIGCKWKVFVSCRRMEVPVVKWRLTMDATGGISAKSSNGVIIFVKRRCIFVKQRH